MSNNKKSKIILQKPLKAVSLIYYEYFKTLLDKFKQFVKMKVHLVLLKMNV